MPKITVNRKNFVAEKEAKEMICSRSLNATASLRPYTPIIFYCHGSKCMVWLWDKDANGDLISTGSCGLRK